MCVCVFFVEEFVDFVQEFLTTAILFTINSRKLLSFLKSVLNHPIPITSMVHVWYIACIYIP